MKCKLCNQESSEDLCPRCKQKTATAELTGSESDCLELLVDQHGLDTVLYALEVICMDKADREAERAGRDETVNRLALRWIGASNRINNARGEINESVGCLP